MILIPDKNTLLVIKEGNFSIENIKLKVMTEKQYKSIQISFDGEIFYGFRNDMPIPKKYHKLNYLSFTLKCTADKEEIFYSERMPLIAFTFLGDRVEDLFPIAVQRVIDMEAGINAKLIELEKRIEELENQGIL